MMCTMADAVQVSAALIARNNRLFIAQRPPHKRHGLLWEFPGGKVEKGETPEISLVREIREELNWLVHVGERFQVVRQQSETLPIELHVFWCKRISGHLELKEHVVCRWVLPAELHHYRLTAADRRLIPRLVRWTDPPLRSRDEPEPTGSRPNQSVPV